MSMKLAPLPLLRCGTYTAYDILTHVAKLMQEEPRRLDMSWFVLKYKGKNSGYEHTTMAPACGTVGCVSGWITMNARIANPLRHAAGDSYQLLGTFNSPSLETDFHSLFFHTHPLDVGNPGSRAYARAVAKRVREVRDKHRTYLKARKIRIRSTGYEVIGA